jgi:DNA-binding transcriptional MerR regulator
MQIKQLASETGVGSYTIRYYEDIGLLPQARRSDIGYRRYNQYDVLSLKFIRRCKDLRMPLVAIKSLVAVQA